MNRKKFLFCSMAFTCLLLSACGNREGKLAVSYGRFPAESSLSAETIPLDTALLRYPYRIAVRGGVAVVMDLHPADHFFHAFTCPGGNHIVSFGRRGEGPEELLLGITFHFVSPDSLWILDANRQQITRWRISAAERKAERMEEIAIDPLIVRAMDFCLTGDGFAVPDYTGDCRFHLLDRQGKRIGSRGKIPAQKRRGSKAALAQIKR
ncbi:MAG: TolB-like 6-bladed beta-propeller domain-containing protein [Tannerella sp.]|jgi:hypothetical protein|nr:TolB-like 6-bladed beta-propeller domain-containing protein [Tannerella sp.]